ncbi:MAG: potassium transporter TrkG [Planctomycetota bacterium]
MNRLLAFFLGVGRRFFHVSPQGLLVQWFGALILAGTLLLMLPWSHASGRVGWLDAFFTATSAACVTGLVVKNTGGDFTPFGQCVILLLIQMGGLGIMTFAALAFRMVRSRFSLASQLALEESFVQRGLAAEFRRGFWQMIRLVAVIEALGAAALFAALLPGRGAIHALFSSCFHSVSAFCNAGFSLYSDNLAGLRENGPALGVVMLLIVLGGLGHPVLLELYQALPAGLTRRRHFAKPRRFSLHARVVLLVTGLLIAAGALGLFFFGLPPEAGGGGQALESSLFLSISSRTAGFNTISTGALPVPSILLLIFLMFVGGSPGSCAGGVKTTTWAVWLAHLRAGLKGEKEVRLLGRSLPDDLTARAGNVVSLGLLWNAAGVLLLALTEHPAVSLRDLFFEQISAFGTVGLSTGLTPHLTSFGRLWIIFTMFIGRIGPLTMVFAFVAQRAARIRHPEGRVMIG